MTSTGPPARIIPGFRYDPVRNRYFPGSSSAVNTVVEEMPKDILNDETLTISRQLAERLFARQIGATFNARNDFCSLRKYSRVDRVHFSDHQHSELIASDDVTTFISVGANGSLSRLSLDLGSRYRMDHLELLYDNIDKINGSVAAIYRDHEFLLLYSSSSRRPIARSTSTRLIELKSKKPFNVLGFSIEGDFVTACADFSFAIYSCRTPNIPLMRYSTSSGILCQLHSENNQMAVVGCRSGNVPIWDPRSKYQVSEICEESAVHKLHLVDDRHLITMAYSGAIKLWDLRFLKSQTATISYESHKNSHFNLPSNFDNSSKTLTAVGSDHVLRMWHIFANSALPFHSMRIPSQQVGEGILPKSMFSFTAGLCLNYSGMSYILE